MSNELEETKQLTAVAQDKMNYDDSFLVYPTAVRQVPLALDDMSDGQGGFYSVEDIESLSSNNWKATKLTDDLEFVQYSFDKDDEEKDVTDALVTMGLIDIRNGRKIVDVTYEELVANGFIICSKREINKLQELVYSNTDELP